MKISNQTVSPQGIHVIDTHYVRPELDASHLVVQGRQALFVDVGTSLSVPYLIDGLHSIGLAPEDVSYIILTHIHLDHAGGAGQLMQRCSNAKLIVHPFGAKHISNPQKLIEASIDIYGEERFAKLYGEIIPIPEDRIISAADGFSIDFNGRSLTFFDTPGHARHHFSVWDPASEGIFTGDTLGIALPQLQEPGRRPFMMPTTTPAAFDPEALERSIGRLLELKPKRFYLAHYGPVQADPGSIAALIDMIRKHRDLGYQTNPDDLSSLPDRISDIIFEAYREYSSKPMDRDDFNCLLAGDIELNAQGIAAWITRLRKKTG